MILGLQRLLITVNGRLIMIRIAIVTKSTMMITRVSDLNRLLADRRHFVRFLAVAYASSTRFNLAVLKVGLHVNLFRYLDRYLRYDDEDLLRRRIAVLAVDRYVSRRVRHVIRYRRRSDRIKINSNSKLTLLCLLRPRESRQTTTDRRIAVTYTTGNYLDALTRLASLNSDRLLRRYLQSARNVSEVYHLINERRRRILRLVLSD